MAEIVEIEKKYLALRDKILSRLNDLYVFEVKAKNLGMDEFASQYKAEKAYIKGYLREVDYDLKYVDELKVKEGLKTFGEERKVLKDECLNLNRDLVSLKLPSTHDE
jgi:uncharacterized protein YnzC (UPF0291/DUF896 family)